MGGFVKRYKDYSIHDTYAGYVVCDRNGTTKFSTLWGLPVVEGMIDDLIKQEGNL